jgi:hypothetical protein
MAKLIFEYAEILDSAGSSLTSREFIRNITVEGTEVTLEPSTVAVEDNREINESFTGRIMIRSTDTNFKQVSISGSLTGATDGILTSDYVSTDGTLPTEAKLRLVGKTGSHTLTTGKVYIMGHNSYENGRLETVLMAQAAEVSNLNAMVVS